MSASGRQRRGGREREFGETLGDGFELYEGGEDDVHVWIAAFRLVDVGDCDCGKDDDGDALCDCRLSIGTSHEVPRVAVALGWLGEFIVLFPSVDASCGCVS